MIGLDTQSKSMTTSHGGHVYYVIKVPKDPNSAAAAADCEDVNTRYSVVPFRKPLGSIAKLALVSRFEAVGCYLVSSSSRSAGVERREESSAARAGRVSIGHRRRDGTGKEVAIFHRAPFVARIFQRIFATYIFPE